MSGHRWFLTSQQNIKAFTDYANQCLSDGSPLTVALYQEERTPDQNALFHKVCRIAADQLGEQVDNVKKLVKLQIGVPILRDTHKEFREKYDAVIKGTLTYEQKLEAMEILPVTSLMTKKEFSQLIDDTLVFYSNQGIDFGELHGSQ